MIEVQRLEIFWWRTRLGINKLQLIPTFLHERSAGLWTDANPVDSFRGDTCPIRFYCDGESAVLKRGSKRFIELQQRLAACTDDESFIVIAAPCPAHCIGKIFRCAESPTIGASADEIRVAELANRTRSIFFFSTPQIASGKSAEYGGAPRIRPFALERIENFLDRISHGTATVAAA